MNHQKARETKAAELMDQAKRALEIHSVFLAGPYINVDEDAEHGDNNATPASRLRYKLYTDFEKAGCTVYLGEDEDLRRRGEKNYGRLSNPVVFERHKIKNDLDCLIVLPSSPGSFCEIGDWASDNNICSKMLVLIDQKYEGHNNYINLGVMKYAVNNKATVQYIPYDDFAAVSAICNEFIDLIAAKKRVDELYDRSR